MLLAGDSGIACSRSHGETVAVDEVTFSVGKGSNATMNAMWTWASGMQDIQVVQDQPGPMSSPGLAVVLCAVRRLRRPGPRVPCARLVSTSRPRLTVLHCAVVPQLLSSSADPILDRSFSREAATVVVYYSSSPLNLSFCSVHPVGELIHKADAGRGYT